MRRGARAQLINPHVHHDSRLLERCTRALLHSLELTRLSEVHRKFQLDERPKLLLVAVALALRLLLALLVSHAPDDEHDENQTREPRRNEEVVATSSLRLDGRTTTDIVERRTDRSAGDDDARRVREARTT